MEFYGTLSIKCPMCGYVNKLSHTSQKEYYHIESGKPFVMCCDSEEGGCDRYFVAEVTLSASVETHTYND